jgi:hypothetical protein
MISIPEKTSLNTSSNCCSRCELLHFLSQQFRNVPHAIRDACLHCRGNTDRAVDAAKIVVREMQAERGPVVLPLLREAIRQSRESPHLHSHGEVLAFDNRGANAARIGIAEYWDHLRAGDFSG